jgi:hypothetical protein
MLFDKMRCTKDETQQIIDIMLRAASIMNFETRGSSRLEVSMDLTACHCVGCPLDLEGLLIAKPSDLIHDVAGIMANINRETGELENSFAPRYAQRAA